MPQAAVTPQEFEKAFQAALPAAAKVVEDKVKDKMAKASMFGLKNPDHEMALEAVHAISVLKTQATFCNNWTKIEGFFNFAMGLAAWIPYLAGPAVLAKAFLAAVKTTLLPIICPILPPPAE